MEIKDILIDDFNDPDFKAMFKRYSTELNVKVKEWNKLFDLMNSEKRNSAYIRYQNGIAIGFIQFTIITFSSGFLNQRWVLSENFGSTASIAVKVTEANCFAVPKNTLSAGEYINLF